MARWCAEWADGLITTNAPVAHLREMIDACRAAGGCTCRCTPPSACWDLDSAETFDIASQDDTLETVAKAVHVSSDLGRHAAQLAEYAALGFDEIAPHHVGQKQDEFVDAFGAKVLPQLKVAA